MSLKRLCKAVVFFMMIIPGTGLPGLGEVEWELSPGLPVPGFLFLSFSSLAYGEDFGTPVGQCQNAFPNLVTDIPWQTMFPIRIGGKAIINSGLSDNVDTENPDCRGFTPGELSAIDFREYMQHVKYTTAVSSEKVEEILNSTKQKIWP